MWKRNLEKYAWCVSDDLSIWNQSIDIDPDDFGEPVSSRTRSPLKSGTSRSGVGHVKRSDPGGQFKIPGDTVSGEVSFKGSWHTTINLFVFAAINFQIFPIVDSMSQINLSCYCIWKHWDILFLGNLFLHAVSERPENKPCTKINWFTVFSWLQEIVFLNL